MDDPSSYGLVRRDARRAPSPSFLEKPDPAEIDTDEVNAGAYVLERSVVDLIPPGRAVSIEREIFPRLVGQGLYGLRLDGYWMDIGTPERYLQASWDILTGAVETEVERAPGRKRRRRRRACRRRRRRRLEAPVAGRLRRARRPVARSARAPCSARDCEIADGRADHAARSSTRAAGSEPARWSTDSILGAGVEVGAGREIGHGSVIGEGARVEPGASSSTTRASSRGVAA